MLIGKYSFFGVLVDAEQTPKIASIQRKTFYSQSIMSNVVDKRCFQCKRIWVSSIDNHLIRHCEFLRRFRRSSRFLGVLSIQYLNGSSTPFKFDSPLFYRQVRRRSILKLECNSFCMFVRVKPLITKYFMEVRTSVFRKYQNLFTLSPNNKQ